MKVLWERQYHHHWKRDRLLSRGWSKHRFFNLKASRTYKYKNIIGKSNDRRIAIRFRRILSSIKGR